MNFEEKMKYISLLLLVFFTSAQVLCMRYARTLPGDRYDTSTAVIVGEVMKLIMSFFLLSFEKGSCKVAASQLYTEAVGHTRNVLLQAVPAILYTIQNNFNYLAISNLEAAVFQVSSQLKLLTAAIFTVTFLKKYIAPLQWLSLVILGVGVILVQVDPSAKLSGSSNMLLGSGTGFQEPPAARAFELLQGIHAVGMAGHLPARSGRPYHRDGAEVCRQYFEGFWELCIHHRVKLDFRVSLRFQDYKVLPFRLLSCRGCNRSLFLWSKVS